MSQKECPGCESGVDADSAHIDDETGDYYTGCYMNDAGGKKKRKKSRKGKKSRKKRKPRKKGKTRKGKKSRKGKTKKKRRSNKRR